MILIFCNPNDAVAQDLHRQLAADGTDAQLVTSIDLVFAPYWNHTLTAQGGAGTVIRLQNGFTIESRKVQAVYNRLSYMEAAHFMNVTDRVYAEMEFTALFISFLKSVGHALLMPLQLWQLNPEGLSDLHVQAAAIAAGLPVMDTHFTTSPRWKQSSGMIPMAPVRPSKDVFYRKSPHLIWEDRPVRQIAATSAIRKVSIAGDRIFSEQPLPFEEALLLLARSLGCLHMDAYIGETEKNLFLYALDTSPRTAGPDAIATIANRLTQKALQPA